MERNGLRHNLCPIEREGLVRLEVGRDRRSRVVLMTEAGHARLAEARPLWLRGQQRFEAAFGLEQAWAMRSLVIAATTIE